MQIDFYQQELVWSAEVYGKKVIGLSRHHVLRLALERIAAKCTIAESCSPVILDVSFVWHPLPDKL